MKQEALAPYATLTVGETPEVTTAQPPGLGPAGLGLQDRGHHRHEDRSDQHTCVMALQASPVSLFRYLEFDIIIVAAVFLHAPEWLCRGG